MHGASYLSNSLWSESWSYSNNTFAFSYAVHYLCLYLETWHYQVMVAALVGWYFTAEMNSPPNSVAIVLPCKRTRTAIKLLYLNQVLYSIRNSSTQQRDGNRLKLAAELTHVCLWFIRWEDQHKRWDIVHVISCRRPVALSRMELYRSKPKRGDNQTTMIYKSVKWRFVHMKASK